jgi:hypothetical protein
MDRRRPLLVNIGEVEAHEVLRAAAERNHVDVFAKVRIADALNIDHSGLSDRDYRYALRAHFDFLVVDAERVPQFAVEFDEPHHDTDEATIARDRMKDSIADRLGLAVIRIGVDFLRTVGRFSLLGWLIDLWFLQRAFDDAQERGEVPYDEPFIYANFFEPRADGKLGPPAYDLSREARMAIRRAHKRGITAALFPELVRPWRYGDEDYVNVYALLPLTSRRLVIGLGRCRFLTRAGGQMPVAPFEVAQDLAIVDVAARLDEIQRGALLPAGPEQLAVLRAETRGWIRNGTLLDDVPPD